MVPVDRYDSFSFSHLINSLKSITVNWLSVKMWDDN